jgi:hypothetical protein
VNLRLPYCCIYILFVVLKRFVVFLQLIFLMDELLSLLRSKEPKERAQALESLITHVSNSELESTQVDTLFALLHPFVNDNNVKAATSACTVITALCTSSIYSSHARSHYTDICDALVEAQGGAKPQSRQRAADALASLVSAAGPAVVMERALRVGLTHKNWRVKEGALSMYSHQVDELGSEACVGFPGFAGSDGLAAFPAQAASLLADAQPDVRKAAADALAHLAIQVGLQKVLSKIEEGVRPAHINNVKERFAEISGSSANAPQQQQQPKSDQLEIAHNTVGKTPVEAVAESLSASAPRSTSSSAVVSKLHLQSNESSSSTSLPASNTMSVEEVSAHPLFTRLVHLNSGPWWRSGVLGDAFTDEEVGRAKKVSVSTLKDLTKFVDEICITCSNTTADWKVRAASMDKLRGLLLGGATSIEGFSTLVGRLKEPLCVQVQDLRSTIVKHACLVVAELSAALGQTQWFEPLADPLIECLCKQTYVTISVIASSAHATILTILHNSRVGFHKVLPKLLACVRTKSSILHARGAEYLLVCIRSWAPSVLEKYAQDLQSSLASLISDADPTARQCARIAYWSFVNVFPARASAVTSRIDSTASRLLTDDEDLARRVAIEDALQPVLELRMSVPPPSTPSLLASVNNSVPKEISNSSLYSTRSGNASARTSLFPAAPPPVPPSLPAPVSTIAAKAQPLLQPTHKSSPPRTTSSSSSSSTSATQSPQRNSAILGGNKLPRAGSFSNGIAPVYNDERGGGPPIEQSSSPSKLIQRPPSSSGADLAASAARVLEGAADPRGFRDRLLGFIDTCVSSRAIDPRVLVRAYVYSDRVPVNMLPSLPNSSLTEAALTMLSSGGGGDGTHVSYQPISSAANLYLEPGAGVSALLSLVTTGSVQRIVGACLSSAHDLVVSDGLALLTSLLDTHVEASALTGQANGIIDSAIGSAIASSLRSAAGSNVPTALVALAPRLSVLLHIAYTSSDKEASALVPIYARSLLVSPNGESRQGGSDGDLGGASDPFRTLFAAIVRLTLAGGSYSTTASQRSLAAMRRALPVRTLLAIATSTLLSTDAQQQPRTQAAALHLVRDMLGDAGTSPSAMLQPALSFFVTDQSKLVRLLSRSGDMLIAAAEASTASGTTGSTASRILDPASPSSPFYRLPILVDQLVSVISGGSTISNNALISALSQVSPDQLRALLSVCDASNGGSSRGLQDAVQKFKRSTGPPPTLSLAAPQVIAQGPPAPPPLRTALLPPTPSTLRQPQLAQTDELSRYVPTNTNGTISTAAQVSVPLPTSNSVGTTKPVVAQSSSSSSSLPSSTTVSTSASPPQPQPAPVSSRADQQNLPMVPLTRSNLELVLDTLASTDKAKQLRALHYFGRAVDTQQPSSQPPNGGAGADPQQHVHPSSSSLQLPPTHRDDPLWLSLFDRVIVSILNCVPVNPQRWVPPSPVASDGTNPPAAPPDPLVLSQTALSVVRKLYRNFTPYVASKSGTVLSVVFGAIRGTGAKDLAAVLERTCEEVTDHLPIEMALTHLVTVLAEEQDNGPAAAAAAAASIALSSDSVDGSAAVAAAAAAAASSSANSAGMTVSCLRCLARLIPRVPSSLLLAELGKGRLMEALRRDFLSTSTDTRRCVVSALVEIHQVMRGTGAFARYAEAYLTPPQLKLLQLYVDKAEDAKRK